jgi:hypothetical protein
MCHIHIGAEVANETGDIQLKNEDTRVAWIEGI